MSTVFDKEEWPIKRVSEHKEYYGMGNAVRVYENSTLVEPRTVHIAIPAGFFTYLKSIGVEDPSSITFYLEDDGKALFFGYQRGDRLALSVDLWSYPRLPAWAKK